MIYSGMILEFVKVSEEANYLVKELKELFEEEKNDLAKIIENKKSNFSFGSKEKHAIRLLIYPNDYNRTIDIITKDFLQSYIDEIMSNYPKRKIEYINTLNTVYFDDQEKENMIQSIKKVEEKRLFKECRKNVVWFFSKKIDNMLYEEFGVS